MRCTGRCCQSFPLPLSLKDMEGKLSRGEDVNKGGGELKKIYEMVLPLTSQDYRNEQGVYMYTCKHLDADNNCGNYANRPVLCSDYPYGNACDHKAAGACTLSDDEGVTFISWPKREKSIMERVGEYSKSDEKMEAALVQVKEALEKEGCL